MKVRCDPFSPLKSSNSPGPQASGDINIVEVMQANPGGVEFGEWFDGIQEVGVAQSGNFCTGVDQELDGDSFPLRHPLNGV